MINKNRLSPGFTLMEILVAMAIMGILAGVGFSSYTVSIQKSRDAQRKSDLNQLQRALESYYSDFGVYPDENAGRIMGCGDGTETCLWGGAFSLDSGKLYMKTIPRDPIDNVSYVYVVSSNQLKYQIFALVENPNDPDIDTYSATCSTTGDLCNYGVSSSNASPDETI